jgi:hypothetical protein
VAIRSNSSKLGSMMHAIWFALTAMSFFALFASGKPATAEEAQEEPKASALLPPKFPTAPPGSQVPRITAKTPTRAVQDKSSPPRIAYDQSKARPPRNKTSVLHHGNRQASKKGIPEPGDRAANRAAHRASRSALASGGEQRRRRRPAGKELDRPTPPTDEYSFPRVESAAVVPMEPPRTFRPYFRGYPPGPPGNGYSLSYPYPWPPPGPDPFRQGF